CCAQFCAAGLKPASVKDLHALLLVTGSAALDPGALAHRPNNCLYALYSAGCLVWILFSTAFANAGVGVVTEKTLGSTKRKPSVSTKKKVLSLRTGPPTLAAHWFAFENGRSTPVALLNQLFEFI